MNRTELETCIEEFYSIRGGQPWMKYPGNTVFRHRGNQKWFALTMDIHGEKLSLSGADTISVGNVKCDTRLIGSFREEPGIFPVYHMNKAHWLTVAQDGTVEDEKLKFLVDMGYELTNAPCFLYT